LSAAIRKQPVRRIVVVFSGGNSDQSVARILPSLIADSAADISAVFLEDLGLFRLAELPFTIELCRVTTLPRPLTTRELERQMKIQALQAEDALRRVAEQVGSSWSFRTHRGRLSTALAEVRDVDLLLIGATRRALSIAGEVRTIAGTAHPSGAERRRPVAVLFERTQAASRALDAGIELAQRTGCGLTIFLPDDAAEVRSSLLRRLQPFGPGCAAIASVHSKELEVLLASVRSTAPVVLVAGAGETGFEESRIGALRDKLRCPILVVR
jgi:hypothetical protein